MLAPLLVLALAVLCAVQQPALSERVTRSLRRRLGVCAAALLLWPALLLATQGRQVLETPISATVCVLVLVYLALDLAPIDEYRGPLEAYEGMDAMNERGVQVSAVAFAVSTLLLSQRHDRLAAIATGPVLMALLLCTLTAVPSAAGRKRAGSYGHAIQKVCMAFAAGLLCVAVARCLDELYATKALAVSVSD